MNPLCAVTICLLNIMKDKGKTYEKQSKLDKYLNMIQCKCKDIAYT